jgi:hypothetical protein
MRRDPPLFLVQASILEGLAENVPGLRGQLSGFRSFISTAIKSNFSQDIGEIRI